MCHHFHTSHDTFDLSCNSHVNYLMGNEAKPAVQAFKCLTLTVQWKSETSACGNQAQHML